MFLVTVPKLVNIVCAPGKWGKIAPNIRRTAVRFHIVVHFRLEVGEIVRHCKTLPNLERSLFLIKCLYPSVKKAVNLMFIFHAWFLALTFLFVF